MRKLLFIIVLSFLLISSVAFAQDFGKVAGRVAKESNDEPLQNVNVFLKNTEFGYLSNRNGQFILNNVPRGRYTLVASLMGYKP